MENLMVTLYIIRGLPGTGKSTLGKTLAPDASFAADDYFMVDGEYKFDPSKLGEAHAQCQSNVRRALEHKKAVLSEVQKWGQVSHKKWRTHRSVSVCNTFSKEWEWRPYAEMAKELGIRYYVINLFDNDTSLDDLFERNVHDVPRHVFKAMYDRWEM